MRISITTWPGLAGLSSQPKCFAALLALSRSASFLLLMRLALLAFAFIFTP